MWCPRCSWYNSYACVPYWPWYNSHSRVLSITVAVHVPLPCIILIANLTFGMTFQAAGMTSLAVGMTLLTAGMASFTPEPCKLGLYISSRYDTFHQ